MRGRPFVGRGYVWERPVIIPRAGLLLALMILSLAACTTTGGSASGGLGATAAGGLLAANSNGIPPAALEREKVTGRLLEGPYVLLLTTDDSARAERAAIVAFDSTPSGQTTIWRNPENGHWGTLTPSRTFRDAEGRYCRDYRQTVTIGGQEHQGIGSACRETGGVWRIMS
jgi:surface antigen